MTRRNSFAVFVTLLSFGIMATALFTVAAQEFTGKITGVVVDAEGKSVAGAWVTVGCGDRPLGGRVPGAFSDEQGHFAVGSLELAECSISACKVQDDIPCPPFFGPDYPVRVMLTATIPALTVRVRLGEKGTVITGTVKDAITGEIIAAVFELHPSAVFELHPLNTIPADFRIFVFPLTDYSLEISAPGYKHWVYADHHHLHKSIRLAPRAHFRLDVKLQPLK
jgi:hypothetical protein